MLSETKADDPGADDPGADEFSVSSLTRAADVVWVSCVPDAAEQATPAAEQATPAFSKKAAEAWMQLAAPTLGERPRSDPDYKALFAARSKMFDVMRTCLHLDVTSRDYPIQTYRFKPFGARASVAATPTGELAKSGYFGSGNQSNSINPYLVELERLWVCSDDSRWEIFNATALKNLRENPNQSMY
ncbi:MAG: hypothetical protein HQL50_09925 [Magnetococcales bacterium]|nr:hypothetical protein [Magnetococcales bacterium]